MQPPCSAEQATEADGSITFQHKVMGATDVLYFAFCYPKSYDELQSQLAGLDADLGNCSSKDAPVSDAPKAAAIYYCREALTYSLDGRRLDLLTVSGHNFDLFLFS